MMCYLMMWIVIISHPDVNRLGSSEWRERELATNTYNNLLSVLLLPETSDDTEIRFRLNRIRCWNLRERDPIYIELSMFNDRFECWVKTYLVRQVSKIERRELFEKIHGDQKRVEILFRLMPPTLWKYGALFLRVPRSPDDWRKFNLYLDDYAP